MLTMCVLFCSCLCKVCSHVSEALMFAMCVLFCSCLCKVCSHVSEALMFVLRTLSCSCLCKVCSHVSEALMLTLRTLSCSFLTNVSCSDSKALLRFFVNNRSLSTSFCAFLLDTKAYAHCFPGVQYSVTIGTYLFKTHTAFHYVRGHRKLARTWREDSEQQPLCITKRGDSPFVYRDRGGWPASLPYVRKIRVSVVIGTQSGIVFTKGYLWSKYGGPQKLDYRKVVKIVKVHFHNSSSYCCCCCCSSVSTRVSPDRVEKRNFAY